MTAIDRSLGRLREIAAWTPSLGSYLDHRYTVHARAAVIGCWKHIRSSDITSAPRSSARPRWPLLQLCSSISSEHEGRAFFRWGEAWPAPSYFLLGEDLEGSCLFFQMIMYFCTYFNHILLFNLLSQNGDLTTS
jgi:hypothetical protein